jgi:propionate catabolism operon transcriptional regulator
MRPDWITGPAVKAGPPQIVAVGFRRINKMLQSLAPEFAQKAQVSVLEVGFEQAVTRIRELQAQQAVDVVVAAGSNGAYLRQHLEMPVVLVKIGGFDLMQALAQGKRLSSSHSPRVGLITYEGTAPELARFGPLFELDVIQRSYQTEEQALAAVRELKAQGVSVVVGTGTVADQADALGLSGIFLYSLDAVREALHDAVEVARASRIELAKRERLGTILAQLSDGVIAVDQAERIQTLNPAMAQWLGITPEAWLGQKLSEVCPELSLRGTLQRGVPELEKIERVRGKALIVNRLPIMEQGALTGAVISCQDPISIQRVDRQIRTRIKPHAQGNRHELAEFLGDSPQAQQVRALALSCARSHATVLLLGESGTGKELVAQGIHMASERRELPFVAVNCAALSETLLESELFGYEDGAFTGARRGGKVGLFEAAHKGSIFLDEIGEMPLGLQARLLRVLQEREVLRVGATEPTPVNVRVIAATHRDLMARVEQGLFRLDLFYRLNILRIDLPALRERLVDVPLIVQALHRKVCARQGVPTAATQALMDALCRCAPHHRWPGHVRELENIIERVVACGPLPLPLPAGTLALEADGALMRLAPELFSDRAHGAAPALALDVATSAHTSPGHAKDQRHREDCAHAERVLAACGGDKAQAAQQLGISRTTLWRRLQGASS